MPNLTKIQDKYKGAVNHYDSLAEDKDKGAVNHCDSLAELSGVKIREEKRFYSRSFVHRI